MKNTILLAIAAFFFAASVNAQTTVDSIAAKYKLLPMPEPLTVEKTFPVLGTYQLANAQDSTATVSISLDSVNKGMVWVEGLPVGRVKAFLRKSPATYRIIAQKSESGKQIPEGTLILDQSTNTLNVALGAPFNETTPDAIFAFNNSTPEDNTVEVKAKSKNAKTKAKVTFYSATKIQQNMAGTQQQPVQQDQQPQQQQQDQK